MKHRRLYRILALLVLLPVAPAPLARADGEDRDWPTGGPAFSQEVPLGSGVAFVRLVPAGEPGAPWTAGDRGLLVVGGRVDEGPEMAFRATVFTTTDAGEVQFDQGPPPAWGDIVAPGLDHGAAYAFTLREGDPRGAERGAMRVVVRVEARTLDENAAHPLVAEMTLDAPVDLSVARRAGREWAWGAPQWTGSAVFAVGLVLGLAMGRTRWDLARP